MLGVGWTGRGPRRHTCRRLPHIPQFDLYGELEVSRSASVETIEAAFRSLVKRYHPDVSKDDDGERIKRINVAREWLTDPDRRRRYDASLRRERPIEDRDTGLGGRSTGGRSGARGSDGPEAGDGGRTADWQPQAPSHSGFGVNTVSVREFLAELRELDEPRAQEVRAAKHEADVAGYDSARRVAFTASRAHRLSEWLFAREAATVIVRRRLGESPLATEIVDPVADVAGAIAIRDLLPGSDFDLLSMPWTRRGGRVLGGAKRSGGGARFGGASAYAGGATAFAGGAQAEGMGADRVHRVATANMAEGGRGPTARRRGTAGAPRERSSHGVTAEYATAPNGNGHRADRDESGAGGRASDGSAGTAGADPAAVDRSAETSATSSTSTSAASDRSTALPRTPATSRSGGVHGSVATAIAITSAGLLVIVAFAAFGGQLVGAPGPSGHAGAAAGPSSSPGSGVESPLPTVPPSQAPSQPPGTTPGGIDAALLPQLQQAVWQTIQALEAAAANGDLAGAKALLGSTAPHLQASGLSHASFPTVAATDIAVRPGTDGTGFVATAGRDTLTSIDGVHWTFAYGNRPLARFGRTVTHDVYWREPLGQHDIDLTLTSITVTRTQLIVGVSWTYGSDPTYGNDGPYFTNDQLAITTVTSGGIDVLVAGVPFTTFDGSAGKATARLDAVVSPTASLTIEVTIINHGSAASLRAFTTIPVTFQIH